MTTLHEHLKAWNDVASGIALLYMGPTGQADEYTERLIAALESENLDEIDHVTGLMVSRLIVRGRNEDIVRRWGDLDRIYHMKFCSECLSHP